MRRKRGSPDAEADPEVDVGGAAAQSAPWRPEVAARKTAENPGADI